MTRNLFLILVFLYFSWCNISFAADATNQIDVSSQIQVTRSGLVFNRSSNTFDSTISVTNTGNPIYNSIDVVITGLPNGVTLANSNATDSNGNPLLQVALFNSPWLSDQKQPNIILKFNNIGKVKFSYNLNFQTNIPIISGLYPNNAPSGTNIKIKGNGFNTGSIVYFGKLKLINTKFISSEELSAIVPFDTNQNGQLLPMSTGNYQLTVDGSIPSNFNVTTLPDNPFPSGTVMNNLAIAIQQSFLESQTNIVSALENFKSQNNTQSSLELYNQLSQLLDLTNTALSQELPNITSEFDPVSLDTLERVLIYNRIDKLSTDLAKSSITNNHFLAGNLVNVRSALKPSLDIILSALLGKKSYGATTQNNADQWLIDRKNSTPVWSATITGLVDPIAEACTAASFAYFVAGVSTPLSIPCAYLKLLNSSVKLFNDMVMASNGTISKFDVSGFSTNNPVITSVSPTTSSKQIKFYVSNVDNPKSSFAVPLIWIQNKYSPMSPVKNTVTILGSVLTITGWKDSHWQVTSQIWNIFTKIAGLNPNITNTPEEGPYSIGMDKVDFNNCYSNGILNSLSNYLSVSIDNALNQAIVNVTNQPKPFTVTTDAFPLVCDINIISSYRTYDEGAAKVEADYIISEYTPVFVSKIGNGKVVSEPLGVYLPKNGIEQGIDCGSGCNSDKGYFTYSPANHVTNVSQVILTATPDSGYTVSGWSGDCASQSIASDGNIGTCTVAMNGNSKNVTATFGDIFVGRWIGKMNNGSDAAITIYKGANSGEYFFSYPNWKPALADGNTLYWNDVTFDSSGCFGKRQTMTLTISVNAGVLVLKKFVEEKMIHPECSGSSGLTWEESFTGKRS